VQPPRRGPADPVPRGGRGARGFLRQLEERRPPDPNVIMNSRLRQKELVEHLAYTANCWECVKARTRRAALRHIHDDLVNVKEMIRHMQLDAQDRILFELGTLEMKADAIEMQRAKPGGRLELIGPTWIRGW